MANPIAASAAATVKINIVNICPSISPEKIENDIRFMFTDKSISSIDINITIMFFLFKNIPITPRKNMIAPNDK